MPAANDNGADAPAQMMPQPLTSGNVHLFGRESLLTTVGTTTAGSSTNAITQDESDDGDTTAGASNKRGSSSIGSSPPARPGTCSMLTRTVTHAPKRRKVEDVPAGLTRAVLVRNHTKSCVGERLLDVLLEFNNKALQQARGCSPSTIAHAKTRALGDRARAKGQSYDGALKDFDKDQENFRAYMKKHPHTVLLAGELVSSMNLSVQDSADDVPQPNYGPIVAVKKGRKTSKRTQDPDEDKEQDSIPPYGYQHATTGGYDFDFPASYHPSHDYSYAQLYNEAGQEVTLEQALEGQLVAFNQTHDWPEGHPSRVGDAADSIDQMPVVVTRQLGGGILASPFSFETDSPISVIQNPFGDVELPYGETASGQSAPGVATEETKNPGEMYCRTIHGDIVPYAAVKEEAQQKPAAHPALKEVSLEVFLSQPTPAGTVSTVDSYHSLAAFPDNGLALDTAPFSGMDKAAKSVTRLLDEGFHPSAFAESPVEAASLPSFHELVDRIIGKSDPADSVEGADEGAKGTLRRCISM